MTHHTELINYIAERIGAETYGEIGVYNPDHNFNKIICPDKIGVDPDAGAHATFYLTSDAYFSVYKDYKKDIWFLDGLHEAEQVRRDITNAWNCLSDNGVIVLHDCNPHKESITHYPRDSREWTGNVYITVSKIGTPKFTVDMDYGCMVMQKVPGMKLIFNDFMEITWDFFNKNRHGLLGLVNVEKALEFIDEFESVKQITNAHD